MVERHLRGNHEWSNKGTIYINIAHTGRSTTSFDMHYNNNNNNNKKKKKKKNKDNKDRKENFF